MAAFIAAPLTTACAFIAGFFAGSPTFIAKALTALPFTSVFLTGNTMSPLLLAALPFPVLPFALPLADPVGLPTRLAAGFAGAASSTSSLSVRSTTSSEGFLALPLPLPFSFLMLGAAELAAVTVPDLPRPALPAETSFIAFIGAACPRPALTMLASEALRCNAFVLALEPARWSVLVTGAAGAFVALALELDRWSVLVAGAVGSAFVALALELER